MFLILKYDFLTGLYNCESFEKEYINFISKKLNLEKISAVFILDLDNCEPLPFQKL